MKKIILTFSIIASCFAATAQVKVGDNPTTVNPNSVLEVESTNKGLLLPRVALTGTANVAPLAAHVAGMTVYNTATAGDVTPGYYYNEGTKWVRIADAASASNIYTADGTLTGNRTVTQGANTLNFVGTGNTTFNSGNVGIGTSSPSVKLQVNGDAAGSGDVANQSIFRLFRPGVSGQRFPPLVDFSLGGTASGTTRALSRFSISLTDGETNTPDKTITTFLSNGNVGIGTTTPVTKLDVIDSSTSFGNFSGRFMNGVSFLTFEPRSVGNNAYNSLLRANDARIIFSTDGDPAVAANNGLVIGPHTMGINSNGIKIMENGNVGIGTTAPTNTLDVNGTARVRTLTSGAATDSIVTVDATGVLTQRSISSVAAAAEPWFNAATGTPASSNTQNIYQLGNVGIGTTNPTSILEVSNQADTTKAAKIIAKPNNVSGGSGISIFNYNGLTTEINTFSPLASGNFGDVPFKNLSVLYSSGDNLAISNNGSGNIYFTTGFGTARQTILNNGNVGIGTKTPSSKLALYESTSGKGAFKVAFGDGGSAGDNSWIGFNHGETSNDANDRARIGSVVSAGGAGNLFFTTGGAGAQTERVRIASNGNVGIGTSSPDVKLQVNGDAAGSGDVANQSIFRLVRPGVSGQRFNPLVDFSLGGTASGTTRAKSRFSISLSDDETNSPDQTIMTLLSGGNVGIGTTAPTSKLQVVGIPAFASDAAAGTAGLTAGAFWQTSGHASLPNGVLMVKQ